MDLAFIRASWHASWFSFVLFLIIGTCTQAFAQADDSKEKDLRPVRNTFESIWQIDNQTVIVPIKGTFEWDIIHRFGTIENGYDDFFGIAAPSNIRLGFDYVPLENLMLGIGLTKERKVWDFSAKYAFLKQKRKGGSPVSMTYFVNMGMDSRDGDLFAETTDRLSFFHQLLVATKVSSKFSLQVAPSLSYFNRPETFTDIEGNYLGKMENKHFALTTLARLKITNATILQVNYDQPLTQHDFNDPEPNISIGVEFVSSSHAFQIFVANFRSITPQYNHLLNQNSFGDGEILIGMNITRLWNF